MAIRDLGYYGYTLLAVRPLQTIAIAAVVGMTASFVSQDAHAHLAAPSQVVGTLVISSIALLWTLLSATAHVDAYIPYWITACLDLLFTVPFIVGAAVLGGPLGGFSCSVLPNTSNSDLLAIQTKAATATSPAAYILFVGDNQATCYQIMAVWGLAIALCVMFVVTGLAAMLLFLGRRRSAALALPDVPDIPDVPETSTATTTTPTAAKTPAALASMDPIPSVIRGPSTMMPLYRPETPGSLQTASTPGKWHGSDEDENEFDYHQQHSHNNHKVQNERVELNRSKISFYHQRGSVRGSLHGSVHSSFTQTSSSSYYSRQPSPDIVQERGASRLQQKHVPLKIQTARGRPFWGKDNGHSDNGHSDNGHNENNLKNKDECNSNARRDGVDADVDIDIDTDSNSNGDDFFDGNLATPLSPPPSSHQNKYGPGGPLGTRGSTTPTSNRESTASSRYANPRSSLSPAFPNSRSWSPPRRSPSRRFPRLSPQLTSLVSPLPSSPYASYHNMTSPSSPSSSSSSAASSSSSPSSPPSSAPSSHSASSGICAPPPAPPSQAATMPTAQTATPLTAKTTTTPPAASDSRPKRHSRSKRYSPTALVARYAPSKSRKRTPPVSIAPLDTPAASSLPAASPASAAPPALVAAPLGPAVLWPQASLPSPSSPSPSPSQQLPGHRRTLRQRIEGWWDLGLLRGGTIKGRGRLLEAAINDVSAMASSRSVKMEPRSAGSSSITDTRMGGQSPIAFV
ncbi:MAG: hypothetical protein STHCBS139747_006730 [Sporothrix thermara]